MHGNKFSISESWVRSWLASVAVAVVVVVVVLAVGIVNSSIVAQGISGISSSMRASIIFVLCCAVSFQISPASRKIFSNSFSNFSLAPSGVRRILIWLDDIRAVFIIAFVLASAG